MEVLGCNCLGIALIHYWNEQLQSHGERKGSSRDRYPMKTENRPAEEINDIYHAESSFYELHKGNLA